MAYKCKKECSVDFKICQNMLPTGALPRTQLREFTMVRRPNQLGRDTTPHTPILLGSNTLIFLPLALTTGRLDLVGALPQIFLSMIAPERTLSRGNGSKMQA